jgi:hypothetical protein
VDRARLEAAIAGLQHRGFEPVALSQVRDAYRAARPLPERSVLLTFDGGYLETVLAVDPLLRRFKWPAAVFLDSGRQEDRDRNFVFFDRLHRMLDSGLWALGTQGHTTGAHPGIPPNPAERIGSFRTSRRFLEDHLRAGAVFALVLPPDVVRSAPEALPELAQEFQLGFVSDLFGVNDRSTDPMRLRRLHFDPDWSAESLVDRIAWSADAPPAEGTSATAPESTDRWVSGAGEVARDKGSLRLLGPTRSDLWFLGSNWAENWILEARIRDDGTEFWIVQDGEAGDRLWRFGSHGGAFLLEEVPSGGPTRVLARAERPAAAAREWKDLTIIKRGSGVWVRWGGRAVFDTPQRLPRNPGGRVGLVAVGSPSAVRLELAALSFRSLDYLVVDTDAAVSREVLRPWIERAERIAAVSPLWVVRAEGISRERPLESDLLATATARFAWDLLPRVQVDRVSDLADARWLDSLADRAQRQGWDGLRLDISTLPTEARTSAARALEEAQSRWTARGLRLSVRTAPRAGEGSS